MNAKRILCALMPLAMVGIMCSCGENPSESGGASGNDSASSWISDEKITLTWWMPTIPEGMKSWNEHPVFKEIEKITNIHIEFQGPNDPSAAEQQFSMLISSGELPDIMTQLNMGYKGGVDQAIEDNLYLRLNDLIDQHMPNLKQHMAENPEIEKVIVSEKGNIGWFPKIAPAGLERQPPYVGPIVRKDWLDKIGMDEPETIADWYAMLKAFKTSLNVKRPLLFPAQGYVLSKAFMNAYQTDIEPIVVDGKVVYGPSMDGMLDYVTEMNKWVNEGLLVCANSGQEPYYNDTTASWVSGYYLFETWKSLAKDPGYHVVGVPFPVLNKGDKLKSTMPWEMPTGFGNAYMITTVNPHPVETAKYFDFLYSDQGSRVTQYGIEEQ